MKEHLGIMLPVFNVNTFNAAFQIAVNKYGSSKEQKFWWKENVYTTEKIN